MLAADVAAYRASSREKQTQMVNNAISKTGDAFVINLDHPCFEERRQFLKTNSKGRTEDGVIYEVAVTRCGTADALNRAIAAGRVQAAHSYLSRTQPW